MQIVEPATALRFTETGCKVTQQFDICIEYAVLLAECKIVSELNQSLRQGVSRSS